MKNYIELNNLVDGFVDMHSKKITLNEIKNKIQEYKENGPSVFNVSLADFALIFVIGKRTYLTRDLFGNVPLYYLIIDKKLYYSTDIIYLIELPHYKKQINIHELRRFFQLSEESSTYNDETLWKGVFSVLPGNILVIENLNNFHYENVFELDENKPLIDPINKFYNSFVNSIEKRINKNQIICSSLSGGLDSSSITSISQKINLKKINTIELRTPFEITKERKYAQDVVDKWQTNHTILSKYPNYFEAEIKNCKISGLPTYSLLTAARLEKIVETLKEQNSKIYLIGEGGDQVLGSHKEYLDELILNVNFKELKKEILNLISKNKIPNKDLYSTPYFVSFFKSTLKNLILQKKYFKLLKFCYYLLNFKFIKNLLTNFLRKNFNYRKIDIDFFYKKLIVNCLDSEKSTRKNISEVINFNKKNKTYLEAIFDDHNIKLREQNFAIAESNNLEFIYPFFDLDLLNIITLADKKLNFGNGIGRNILRLAMVGSLPDSIISRNSKTSFSPFLHQVFWDLYEEGEKKFHPSHILWTYLDFSIYNKILTQVKNTNYYDTNNYGLKNFYLILIIKIYYFGIWLDVYFNSN